MKLSLTGYGRGDVISPVGDAKLLPNQNRIDYERGQIVEWYVNDTRGLEQGFTLHAPPGESELRTEPAFLTLALGGPLSLVISADGQAIDFAAPDGAKVLHYAHLKVTDAGGRELPARLEGFAEAGARGIRIVFEDAGAACPVTVDPLLTSPAWTAEGDQATAFFGASVATAGDVNGDGSADVIVGAQDYSNGQGSEGGAFLYYGNDGLGLALRPQQRRADDHAPIAAGGRSREPDRFRLAALGRTPFGRGRVRLEWEAKPLGQPFDGSGTGLSSWSDTGTAGAAFNELLSGLEPGAWHWRMRLHYDQVTTPLQAKSRWFTVPWDGWQERDLTLSSYIGGRVWEDRDGDGLMDEDEPRLGGVLVLLIDGYGNPIQGAVTASDGSYGFDTGSGGVLAVRFQLPTDWYFTVRDQGTDDTIDSDADTITGETAPILPPFGSADATRWSAGMRRLGACIAPDEPVYISGMRLSTDGNDYPILDFQDPNQPADVTGYNVYRTDDPILPHGSWPMVASDVVDMDEAEPNKQWVDTTGDEPPGGIWYYQVAPYNHICDAGGPW